jgi:hypothetical protein
MSTCKVRFTGEFPGAKNVFLTGDFRGWTPTAHRMKRVRKGEDLFVVVLDLNPGRHEFKYIRDGEWACDAHLPRVANSLGGENSVIEVAPLARPVRAGTAG